MREKGALVSGREFGDGGDRIDGDKVTAQDGALHNLLAARGAGAIEKVAHTLEALSYGRGRFPQARLVWPLLAVQPNRVASVGVMAKSLKALLLEETLGQARAQDAGVVAVLHV